MKYDVVFKIKGYDGNTISCYHKDNPIECLNINTLFLESHQGIPITDFSWLGLQVVGINITEHVDNVGDK